MKIKLLVKQLTTLTILFAHCLIYAESQKCIINEKYDKAIAPGPIKANDWWKRTYQSGEYHKTTIEYKVISEVSVSNPENAMVNFVIEGNVTAYFSGFSNFMTQVLYSDKDSLKLNRHYIKTSGERTILYEPSDSVKSIVKTVFEEKAIERLSKKGIDWTQNALITWAVTGDFITPSAGLAVTELVQYLELEKMIQEKFNSFMDDYIDRNKAQKDGMISIDMKKNKTFLCKIFSTKYDNINSTILRMEEPFSNGKGYYIDLGKDGILYAYKCKSKVDVNKDTNFNKTPFESAEEIVDATIQRESHAINENITGGKNRKIGDIWLVDANFLNQFLHSDFKGCFSGHLCLKYEGDVVRHNDITDRTKAKGLKGDTYEAICIKMISDIVPLNGRKYRSDYRYDEDAFTASLDASNSNVEIYVDKKTGVLREVDVYINFTTKSLPDIPFAKGLKVEGNANIININYKSNVSK